MNLHTVTITGADDHTAPEDLLAFSADYPFVEWGLLLSAQSKPRYPSSSWLDRLEALSTPQLCCAGHLCGRSLNRLVRHGEAAAVLDRPLFRRIQLNLSHYALERIELPALTAALPSGKDLIVQVGEALEQGLAVAAAWHDAGHRVGLLFDRSGGRGRAPEHWPDPVTAFPCGYAGRFNPDNLDMQLSTLSERVGDTPIWIDMQSGVRTAERLDLGKVRACLDIATRWIPSV